MTSQDFINFSQSRFSTLIDCSGKYYYQEINKPDIEIVEKTFPRTIMGLITHRIIELAMLDYKTGDFDLKSIIEYVDTYFERAKKDVYAREFEESKKKFIKTKGYDQKKDEEDTKIWSRHILNFLKKNHLNKIESVDSIYPEKKYECFIDHSSGQKIRLSGIVDLSYTDTANQNHMVDFKTTKDNSTYYFVYFENDIQSVVYYIIGKKAANILYSTFSYLVANNIQKTIFQNVIDFEKAGSQNIDIVFNVIINTFYKLHLESFEPSSRTPEETKCRWCNFSDICEKSLNTKKVVKKQ